MSRRQPVGRLTMALLFTGMGALPLAGQDASGTIAAQPTILDRSPFIPPDWTPPESGRSTPAAKPTVTGYEFRGVYKLGDEFRFLVSPPKSRNGKWVELGKEYEDYEVRGYNADTETLTLFYNSKEEAIKLASLEANPTPMPVSGQVKTASRETPGEEGNRTVRRTIRPATRSTTTDREPGTAPPPPAWLQKLREEAAQRRAQAAGEASGGAAGSAYGSRGMNATGDIGPTPEYSPGPPPNYTPPPPPDELLNMEIPPPPSTLPPEPPPEVMQKILQSAAGIAPGT